MKLYYSDILSARRACSVAQYLNAPVQYIYLDFAKLDQQKPDYLALNPNGKVPTLVRGERITWESDAVICQLSEDMSADLWPHDSRQIEIMRWFSWNQQHFSRACGSLYFENIVKKRFGIGAPDSAEVTRRWRVFAAGQPCSIIIFRTAPGWSDTRLAWRIFRWQWRCPMRTRHTCRSKSSRTYGAGTTV